MKFTGTKDRDEDGVCIAECPTIPGCVGQGAQWRTLRSLIGARGLTVDEFLSTV